MIETSEADLSAYCNYCSFLMKNACLLDCDHSIHDFDQRGEGLELLEEDLHVLEDLTSDVASEVSLVFQADHNFQEEEVLSEHNLVDHNDLEQN